MKAISLKSMLVLSLFLISSQVVFAQTRYQCAFEKTLSFGAGISGNMMTNPMKLKWAESLSLKRYRVYENEEYQFETGYGPANYLSYRHADKSVDDYLVSYFGNIRTGLDFIDAYFEGEFYDGKSAEYVRRKIDSAKTIIGVDTFFYSAAANDCRYYLNGDKSVDYLIKNFIEQMSSQDKSLLLATVGKEVDQNIIYTKRLNWTGQIDVPSADDIGESHCADSINRSLIRHCKPENSCYLARLDIIVDQLNTDGEIALSDSNNEEGVVMRTRDELRPDGLFLSHEGSRLIYENYERQMDNHPPKCVVE